MLRELWTFEIEGVDRNELKKRNYCVHCFPFLLKQSTFYNCTKWSFLRTDSLSLKENKPLALSSDAVGDSGQSGLHLTGVFPLKILRKFLFVVFEGAIWGWRYTVGRCIGLTVQWLSQSPSSQKNQQRNMTLVVTLNVWSKLFNSQRAVSAQKDISFHPFICSRAILWNMISISRHLVNYVVRGAGKFQIGGGGEGGREWYDR
jgi:hypothetical protein